jgi:hypothetical protein
MGNMLSTMMDILIGEREMKRRISIFREIIWLCKYQCPKGSFGDHNFMKKIKMENAEQYDVETIT